MRAQMKALVLLLPLTLAIHSTNAQAGNWLEDTFADQADRFHRFWTTPRPKLSDVWKKSSCRTKVIAAATVVALASSYTYYNAFSWRYPEGSWRNVGTEKAPILVPEVGNEFHVMERITRLSRPSERTLWVHDGKHGYGKLFFRHDRIEHYRGNELVAKTNIVAPEGRPYDKAHPISVCVLDKYDHLIGTIVEISDESSLGVHNVEFMFLNEKGVPVAHSAQFSEKGNSQRISGRWQIDFPEDGFDLTRDGWISSTYHWKAQGQAEQSVDPRLMIFLPALRSLVEEVRQ